MWCELAGFVLCGFFLDLRGFLLEDGGLLILWGDSRFYGKIGAFRIFATGKAEQSSQVCGENFVAKIGEMIGIRKG